MDILLFSSNSNKTSHYKAGQAGQGIGFDIEDQIQVPTCNWDKSKHEPNEIETKHYLGTIKARFDNGHYMVEWFSNNDPPTNKKAC